MIPFKQYINEDIDLDIKLRKLGLKRGGAGYKVGKVIGGEIYVHRNYEDQFPSVPLQNAKNQLPKNYDYRVVKYNPKTGTFSFIKSNDFDSNPEPSVDGGVTVKSDGSAKEFGNAGWIYHHKWQWVDDDYKGFDSNQSKQRSLDWTNIVNQKGIPKSKIGQRKFWDVEVVPYLKEN